MRIILLTISLLGLALSGSAASIKIDCPQTIEIDQTIDIEDPSWEQVPDKGLPPASLITIAVYTQHPGDSGTLIPDKTARSADMQMTTWRLPTDSAPYWVACTYTNSRILLAKRLPNKLKQCQLTEALQKQRTNGVVSFECQ